MKCGFEYEGTMKKHALMRKEKRWVDEPGNEQREIELSNRDTCIFAMTDDKYQWLLERKT
jgi:RimJ/RimL family protein N-acetyltransferase